MALLPLVLLCSEDYFLSFFLPHIRCFDDVLIEIAASEKATLGSHRRSGRPSCNHASLKSETVPHSPFTSKENVEIEFLLPFTWPASCPRVIISYKSAVKLQVRFYSLIGNCLILSTIITNILFLFPVLLHRTNM